MAGFDAKIQFTFREREILKLFSFGNSPARIGDLLGHGSRDTTAVATINLHLRNCVEKAGLADRSELPVYLMQQPQVMELGGRGRIGIHALSQTCGCPWCTGRRSVLPAVRVVNEVPPVVESTITVADLRQAIARTVPLPGRQPNR